MATPTFKRLTLAQFLQVLEKFSFSRQVNAVHMHHTWRPRREDFRGHDTIVAMWRHHTQVNKWSDIAQHLTIDPEGAVWLGRNWNRPPASASGHNGNSAFGPFMFEMVGDFDQGRDPFDGAQKDTALRVVAAVQQRFQLATDTLRFHNMMSSKSCPGSALDYAAILAEVDAIKQQPVVRAAATRRSAGVRAPFPQEPDQFVADAIAAITSNVSDMTEPGDAELAHDEHEAHAADGAQAAPQPQDARGGVAPRAAGLSTAQLAELRPYLVNLTAGRFSSDGQATTSPADVDAIFEEHLPRALQENGGAPIKLLFYAHGGLTSETRGLEIAHKQVAWWRANRIYPIHFAWETAFFQMVRQLLSREPATRGLRDFLADLPLELLARRLGGVKVWGAMKANAERAADAPTASNPVGGGAHYVATRLKLFCDAHPGQVELHAVGHSAGSVFHAHFLPLAQQLGVPRFKSAHFMAPAIRVDTFKDCLLERVGQGAGAAVESLTLFTMLRDYERADHCARIYGKSLLYLIHHALEDRAGTPILGLEDSLRADPDLKRFFGLGGKPSDLGTVIWSRSPGDTGRSASQATAHGDFDDDVPTMNSIARRVLSKEDADQIVGFPPSAGARATGASSDPWDDDIDWPEPLREALAAAPMPGAAPAPLSIATPMPVSVPAPQTLPGSGRRIAVCVGINAYPDLGDQLGGCVNDARRWSQALQSLGFDTALLLDGQATRAAIEQSLRRMVDDSRPGDVIVFQYAGHGTHVADLNGDEKDGQDEALCPVDFRAGALFLDDDIGQVLARVPEGVNMTLFLDCCHSGTMARFARGMRAAPRPPGSRVRYVQPTAQLQEAHRSFRAQHPDSRAVAAPGARVLRDVKFSACRDDQVALESNGSGEFTLRALQILQGGIGGLSHTEFQRRVVDAFGPNAEQNPQLDCADSIVTRSLLAPLADAGTTPPEPRVGTPLPADARVLETVNLLSRAIQTLTGR